MAATPGEALYDILDGDATLSATLTGGVYYVRSDDKAPINEDDTAGAYEEVPGSNGVKRLLPCAVITPSNGPDPVNETGSDRIEWYRIGVYEREGYANCEAALDRIHTLLHHVWDDLDDGRGVRFEHVGTPFRGQTDDTIETGDDRPASYEAARYACVTSW